MFGGRSDTDARIFGITIVRLSSSVIAGIPLSTDIVLSSCGLFCKSSANPPLPFDLGKTIVESSDCVRVGSSEFGSFFSFCAPSLESISDLVPGV